VLLDNQTKEILDYLVVKRKKSAGSVFRELLLKEGKRHNMIVAQNKKRSRGDVLDDIIRLRKYINTKGINYREMIDDGRKY